MLLVGFSDKLRLMAVLMDDLKTVKELAIRGCRDVAFSHGGHLFAAVNGISVGVYNSYTVENIGNLRGHNGKVRSLCWSADDTRLLSSGADGAVYEWRLSDLKREKENVLKGCAYNAAVATPDNRALLAAGSDRKIKELEDAAGTGTQVSREVDAGVAITALALPYGGRVLFAGTEAGAVRGYRYPLTGEFYELKLHAGPVTRLAVSYDDCLLLSGGADGAVVVLDVRDKELAKASTRREQEKLPWAEEVLVSKAELDERRARVTELEQQVAELTMQTEYQLRLKDLHLQERLKEVVDRMNGKQEADRQKFEMLLGEKNEQEMEYEEKLKSAEGRAAAQLAALDGQYQAKLMAEVERYSSLLQEKEALNERWDEQNALLVESHERVIAELTEEYEAKLAEEALAREALRQEKKGLEWEFAEVKRQMEEDADAEIEDLRDKYESRLGGEREAALRLKGENGIMRKKFQGLAKDLDEQREALAAQHEQQKDLYATIKGLEKDIAGLKREIRERDDTIGDKERRIYELKKKNQELEKFKFVLDFKIKELKKQIEPREVEISKMRQIVSAMDAELERYHKSNAGLDLAIQSLKLKKTGLQSEVLQQRGSKSEVTARLDKVIRDIAELSPVIQDPKALKDKAKALFQRHCGGAALADAPDDAVASEHARQRQYLERTVDGLKKKLAADGEAHRLEGLHVMSQNVALIREINELRREIKASDLGRALKAPAVAGRVVGRGSLASLSSSYASAGAAGKPRPPPGGAAAAAAPRGLSSVGSSGAGGKPQAGVAGSCDQAGGPGAAAAVAAAAAEAEAAGARLEVEMQAALIERLRAELDSKVGVIRSLAAGAGGGGAGGGGGGGGGGRGVALPESEAAYGGSGAFEPAAAADTWAGGGEGAESGGEGEAPQEGEGAALAAGAAAVAAIEG
ncbi:MAG: hypothetical protein J3K34DRAFT_519934 [Monoraphidium minutum]|nr:MAG: hypothetical protein J3K34DRAFT_519934 [Monoraphidium minutum]